MERVKDWIVLDPIVLSRHSLTSKWFSVVNVPVDRPVNADSYQNVIPLHKFANRVRCCICATEIRLNVPEAVVFTETAFHANISMDNVHKHFQSYHSTHSLCSSS